MPMPTEYHDNHENANFALGVTQQDAANMTANMYRVGGELHSFQELGMCRDSTSGQ